MAKISLRLQSLIPPPIEPKNVAEKCSQCDRLFPRQVIMAISFHQVWRLSADLELTSSEKFYL
jgi:hypothetical protein